MIKYRISQPPTNPNLPILGDKIIYESDFTTDLNEHAHPIMLSSKHVNSQWHLHIT